MNLNDEQHEQIVGQLLDSFYARRNQRLGSLQLKDTLKRKNPYLFRANGSIDWEALLRFNSGIRTKRR